MASKQKRFEKTYKIYIWQRNLNSVIEKNYSTENLFSNKPKKITKLLSSIKFFFFD